LWLKIAIPASVDTPSRSDIPTHYMGLSIVTIEPATKLSIAVRA